MPRTLYDDEGNPVEVPDANDVPVGDLRKQIEEANKALKASEKERLAALSALAPYREREREAALTEAIGSLGKPAVVAWMRTRPDVEPNEETVAAFVEEFGFAPPQTAAPAATGLPAPGSGPTPFVFEPTTGGGPPMQQRVPKSHYDELMRSGQRQEAYRLLTAGLVDGVTLPT